MSDQPLQSFLDSGTSFEGKVVFSGVVRIDGHFRGEASADGTLVIGKTGVVEADLSVGTLIIEGSVTGKIRAKERVELASGSRVNGEVVTPVLRVDEGADISARVQMGEPAPPARKDATEAGAPAPPPPKGSAPANV